jgi:hypothetical protein
MFVEADRLFSEVVAADPENLDVQLRLARCQADLARLERDESHFGAAVELYGRALERLLRLEREGRLEGRPSVKVREIARWKQEMADCEAAPVALEDLDSVRSRPSRVACQLLVIRARLLLARGKTDEALATIEALGSIGVDDPEDALVLARALAASLPLIPEDPAAADSSALRDRTAGRAVAALSRAADLGFRDADRVERDGDLAPVRQVPGYRAALDRMKGTTPE